MFIDLPETGATLAQNDAAATVESVKAASDVYSPIAGTVTEVNTLTVEEPDQINARPESTGWLVKLKPSDPAAIEALMDRDAYEAFLGAL